jgi:hypothetical protein
MPKKVQHQIPKVRLMQLPFVESNCEEDMEFEHRLVEIQQCSEVVSPNDTKIEPRLEPIFEGGEMPTFLHSLEVLSESATSPNVPALVEPDLKSLEQYLSLLSERGTWDKLVKVLKGRKVPGKTSHSLSPEEREKFLKKNLVQGAWKFGEKYKIQGFTRVVTSFLGKTHNVIEYDHSECILVTLMYFYASKLGLVDKMSTNAIREKEKDEDLISTIAEGEDLIGSEQRDWLVREPGQITTHGRRFLSDEMRKMVRNLFANFHKLPTLEEIDMTLSQYPELLQELMEANKKNCGNYPVSVTKRVQISLRSVYRYSTTNK